VWRHSFNARYKIRNLPNGADIAFPHGDLAGEVLQLVEWAPSTSALSFVYQNNLYVQLRIDADPIQITTTGHPTDVFNGIADWLYEEDVISESSTHYWSPDNEHIAYARINVTNVPVLSWPVYGDKSDVFGETHNIRYPKAGHVMTDGKPGPTAEVELFVVSVTATEPLESKRLPPPIPFDSEDHYYLQVEWINETHVFVMWANRVQNRSISVFYDVTENEPSPFTVLDYTETNGWLEVVPPKPWFTSSDSYVTIHPRKIGNGQWRQPAIISLNGTGNVTHLITGDLEEEVDTIYAFDKVNNIVYYSTTHGNAMERMIWRVGTPDAAPADRNATCVTCNMPPSCRYITSSFSSNAKHFMVNCRGPEIPTTRLRRVDNATKDEPMELNADVKALLDMKALPTRVFFKIPVDEGRYEADAELFIPPGHEDGMTYPLLVYAYAGPGSQRVVATYPIGGSTTNWLMYLKSTHKLAMVSIDSRGASGRGDAYKFLMYRNMGTVEIQDHIQAGRFFQTVTNATLKIVNVTKPMAIFGWSYGGFTTAHVLGDTTEVFKCGVSVAPATTFRFYDSAYTERFLGLATPNDDELGYNQTDVIAKAGNFRNKKFMIAHGIADDNVHFMHTTHMIRALSDAGVMFRQNIYVDQDHSITAPGQSRHLYQSMTEFLLNDCWGTTKPLGTEDDAPPASTVPPSVTQTNSIVVGLLLLCSLLALWI